MDNEWVWMLWTQAWQVSALILFVAAVSRLWGRNHPHFAHILWVVVLIKALTPPLFSSPSGVFSWLQPARLAEEISSATEPEEPPAEVSPPSPPPSLTETLLEEDWELPSESGIPIASDDPTAAGIVLEAETLATIKSEERESLVPVPASSKPETDRPTWSLLLFGVWLSGAAGSLLVSLLRWVCCLKEIRKSGVVDDPFAQQLLEDLLARLGVRRKVRLIISQSRIGPAVLGIFRPTVLVPARILAGKTPADLEPILAHELIHIRRGDLWVGWLQVLAEALWWFNPLVWWAGRRLKHEAERCCDEEVIAELGLKPARYARALLDVLELKQILKPVPVLPGVKPVEITSKRLERIMLLGQGCRKRTPWWCWLAMLLAAALTLPGAAFVAQAKDKRNRTSHQKSENQNTLRTRTFQVGDVLERIQAELGVPNEAEARRTLVLHLKAPVAELWEKEILLTSRRQVTTPSLSIKGNRLTVRHTPRVVKKIAEQLEILREHGFESIEIEIRILTAGRDVLENVEISWQDVSPKAEGGKKSAASQETGNAPEPVVGKSEPLRMAILGEAQFEQIIETCQANERSNIMLAPKVRVYNGRTATIQSTVHRPFVVGVSEEGEPIIRVVPEGTTLKLRPVLDGEHIRLESELTLTDIRDVKVKGSSDDETSPKIQVPEITTVRIKSSAKLQNGGSVLLAGPQLPDKPRVPRGRGILQTLAQEIWPETAVWYKKDEPKQQLFVLLRAVRVPNAETAPMPSEIENRAWGSGIEWKLPLGVRAAQTTARHAELEYRKALEARPKSKDDEPATLLYFEADWCGPCKQMDPIISRLKRQGYPVRNVDVEKQRDLAQRYNVRSLPTFVLLADGQELKRIVGLASERELQRMLGQVPRTLPAPPKAMPHKTLPYQGQGVNSDAGLSGQITLNGRNFETEEEALEAVLDALRTNRQIDMAEGCSLSVLRVRGKTLIKPTLQHHREGKGTVTTQAETGTIGFDPEKQQFILHLVRGQTEMPGRGRAWFERLQIPFGIPQNVDAATNPQKHEKSTLKDSAVVPSAYERHSAGEPKSRTVKSWDEFTASRTSDAEKHIAKQFEQKISLRFDNTPFKDAMQQVAKDAGLSIVVDEVGLAEEGLKADHAISIDVKDVKLSSALNSILKPLNLGYLIEDEVVKITSKQRIAMRTLTVVSYPVADLVVPIPQKAAMDLREMFVEPKPAKPAPPKPAPSEFEGLIKPASDSAAFDFDNLTQLITTTVEPNSWAKNGGFGKVRSYETTLSLVVRQSQPVHEQIRDLLEQLRAMQDLQVALSIQTIDGGRLEDRTLALKLLCETPVSLTPEDVEALKTSLSKQGIQPAGAFKVTLYNGQMLNLILPTGYQNGLGLDLSPVISPDRRFVRMGLTLGSKDLKNQQTGRQITLKDGHSVLMDLSRAAGKKNSDGSKLVLITPRIIVEEEEEELLGIPIK